MAARHQRLEFTARLLFYGLLLAFSIPHPSPMIRQRPQYFASPSGLYHFWLKMPEFLGGEAVYDYRLDGDVLTLEQIEEYLRDGTLVPWPFRVKLKLRRVE